jgi:acylphosphatase
MTEAKKEEVVPTGPFAKFGKMWGAFAEKTSAAANGGQKIELPADKLKAVANQLNFTGAVTKEQLAAIANGGDEAVAAMLAIVNTAGQEGFQKSAQVSAKMLEDALKTQAESFKASLPDLIKEVQSGVSVSKAMPGLDDPALAPMVNMVRAGIQANNPGASADEVAVEVKEYFSNLAEVVSPRAGTEGADKEVQMDWNAYLDLKPLPDAKAA